MCSSAPWGLPGTFAHEYSYTTAGCVTTQRLKVPQPAAANFDATDQWDADGRMTALNYPSSSAVLTLPPAYAYTYDSMGHLSAMTENGKQVASAGYNWADQLTGMTYDSFSEGSSDDPVMRCNSTASPQGRALPQSWMTYSYTAGRNKGPHHLLNRRCPG